VEATLVPRWSYSDRAVFDRDGSLVAQVRTAEDARRIAAAVTFAECVPTDTLEAWTVGVASDSASGLAVELESLLAAAVLGQPPAGNERRGGERRSADRRRPSARGEVAKRADQ
jgi:hypothetical protein